MRRYLWIAAALAILGVVLHDTSRGQVPGAKPNPGDLGPGDKGATLRLPGVDSPPPPKPVGNAPTVPAYVRNLYPSPGGAYPQSARPGEKIAQLPSNNVSINKDIEITPEAGPWAIFVMAYSGPKAPEMARKLVAELRNTYKLYAYVYNSGAEEKKKEFERVQKLRKEQMDALQKAGLKADVPIRIPTMRIDEQTCVLIGGYRTRDEAIDAILRIRELPPPNPKKVDLDTKFVGKQKLNPVTKMPTDEIEIKERVYVNPFKRAFPSRNPSAEKDRAENGLAEEIQFLRKVNQGEPLSLFHCKKPYTLAIKQFTTQYKTTANDKEEAKGFLTQSKAKDNAFYNAHDLAEAMRKAGLPETYVLHSRYSSFVTVGGFDGPEDPQLKAMQTFLENRFRSPAYEPLQMYPRPVPLQVPR